jgi:hypothetical protein
VQGFPTLKLFHKGFQFEYQGHPTPKKLAEFIEKKTGPASLPIKNDEDFEKVKNSKFTVAYFGETGEDFEQFLHTAIAFQNVDFRHSFDKKYLELNGNNQLTIFTQNEDGNQNYDGLMIGEDIQKWVLEHK